jgi:hypothetical protein
MYNTYIVTSPFQTAVELPEGPKRTAAVAAWIQSLYSTRPAVLVGGAAVELYTGGAYTTGDYDFVGGVPEPVAAALVEAGFKREGRHWIHADAELFVEFPGGAVQAHEKTAILEVGGVSVLTLSPEDLIVDRLAAWQFWRSTTDGASAYLIWKAQARNIERGRLAHLAKRRGVEKGLARLDDFIRSVGSRTPSAEELETWANRIP